MRVRTVGSIYPWLREPLVLLMTRTSIVRGTRRRSSVCSHEYCATSIEHRQSVRKKTKTDDYNACGF
eukprot:SAG11_NODE_416_length_9669_cov_7.135528_3_plen_67_part_00